MIYMYICIYDIYVYILLYNGRTVTAVEGVEMQGYLNLFEIKTSANNHMYNIYTYINIYYIYLQIYK